MDSSRENSPDWLRSFQPPSRAMVSLSSDSKSSAEDSPSKVKAGSPLLESDCNPNMDLSEDAGESMSAKNSKLKLQKNKNVGKSALAEATRSNRLNEEDDVKSDEKDGSMGRSEIEESSHSIMMLSSDTEPCSNGKQTGTYKSPKRGKSRKNDGQTLSNKDLHAQSLSQEKKHHPPKKGNPVNKFVKNEDEEEYLEVPDKETAERHSKPSVSSTELPLVLPEKVHRTKALVECEGESIDLSGDMGAVGRVVFTDSLSGDQDMHLDLKGTLYKASIVPSRTFCVVSFGQSEAKIEAVMNDFIQLKPQSNVFEAETVLEGTLHGFSFESEDEEDKIPKAAANQTEQNEGNEEKGYPKTKGKLDKISNLGRKRERAQIKTQTAKKARKKGVTSKKSKGKK